MPATESVHEPDVFDQIQRGAELMVQRQAQPMAFSPSVLPWPNQRHDGPTTDVSRRSWSSPVQRSEVVYDTENAARVAPLVQRKSLQRVDIDGDKADSIREERATIDADAPAPMSKAAPSNRAGRARHYGAPSDIDGDKADSIREERATIGSTGATDTADAGRTQTPRLSPPQTTRAIHANIRYARKLGYTPADFGILDALDSAGFASTIADRQEEAGLEVDGIAGPHTHAALAGGVATGGAPDVSALFARADLMRTDIASNDTQTPDFGGAAVQAKATDAATGQDADTVQQIAASGVDGSGGQLPHLATIQAAFGQHDVTGVKAHTGGKASAAAAAIGAEAYATGDSVAFAATPSLHTAAHEAAHVVQQRGGVQLKGGVGQAGDTYEQHADAVADAVVRGDSAEAMLGTGLHSITDRAIQATVQRWETDEHKKIIDEGSRARAIRWNSKGAKVPFVLTHGDIGTLTGDYFSPDEADRLDCLSVLAAIPSSDPGKNVGTQDEIIYALSMNFSESDARFRLGGDWHGIHFSDAVKKRVKDRYGKRASQNRDHFVSPEGKNERLDLSSKWKSSAGTRYRRHHEDAIFTAYAAGSKQMNIADAMVKEAMAQHFLTDAFAGGHLRTPRASLTSYWLEIHPEFFNAFKLWVAAGLTDELGKSTQPPLAKIPRPILERGLAMKVDQVFESLGEYHLGDVLSKVVHDFDNDNGVKVTNDVGHHWTAYGDGNLNKIGAGDSISGREVVEGAVYLGLRDIEQAFEFGKIFSQRDRPLDPRDIIRMIRSATSGQANAGRDKYGAEQLMPRVESDEAPLVWMASSLSELYTKPLGKSTWGQEIEVSVSQGGPTYREIENGANSLDEEMRLEIPGEPLDHWYVPSSLRLAKGQSFGTVYPARAFRIGFLKNRLAGNVLSKLLELAVGNVPAK